MAALAYLPDDAFISNAEYLAIEERTQTRHEWFNGRVYAMAGASTPHNIIVSNLSGMLYNQLRGRPCHPLGSDQRVRIVESDLKTYPDVLVACPPHEWDAELPHTLLNPRVIFEVLSPSTERYDRGEKFNHYRRIPSLSDYILVSSTRMHVEHFQRQSERDWHLHIAEDGDDEIAIESIDCRLVLRELYERLEEELALLPERSDFVPGD